MYLYTGIRAYFFTAFRTKISSRFEVAGAVRTQTPKLNGAKPRYETPSPITVHVMNTPCDLDESGNTPCDLDEPVRGCVAQGTHRHTEDST